MATRTSASFLKWLNEWYAGLARIDLKQAVGDPACTALCAEDVVNGYFVEGEFASPRLTALAAPIARLFQRAHDRGVRNFVLLQDAHGERAAEFKQFPPHCIRGTRQAQMIDALRALSFADTFFVVKKNSFHPALNTDLDRWLDTHQDLDTFIVVGGCTDLSIYPMAMHLKQRANSHDLPMRVIVPADLVDTYDLSAADAKGACLPHDGDLLQRVFLYHMALAGIEIVKHIE